MRARWMLIAALLFVLLLPAVAAAQFGPVGPGGQLASVLDELTVSNIASATDTSILPPSGTSYGSGQFSVSNCAGVVCVLELDGELYSSNSSPGTFTIKASIGYVPTLTVVSARTLETNMTGIPFNLKCKRSPDATVGSAPRGGAMYCSFRYVPSSTTEVVINSFGQGLLPVGGNLGVIATIAFGTGQKGNGIIVRAMRFGQGT